MRINFLTQIFICCLYSSTLLAQALLPLPNLVIDRNIVYRTIGGTTLALDTYRDNEAVVLRPVILAIHGGSWIDGDRSNIHSIAEALAARGYAVVACDYRPTPRWTFPAQLDDVCAAEQWVRDNAQARGFDLQRFFVLGVSAGGQLAGLLGTQEKQPAQRFTGAILLAAPTDFHGQPARRACKNGGGDVSRRRAAEAS